MSTTTHCQVCGRAIKTVRGYQGNWRYAAIDGAGRTARTALHGYRRPTGWHSQTASCFGARWRPYEVACDALPPVIAMVEEELRVAREQLAALVGSPPATLTFDPPRRRPGIGSVLVRPEGFSPGHCHSWRPGSYEDEFARRRRALEGRVREANADLVAFRRRLAEWRP